MKKITARAPLRLDFAGAWTDVPIFANQFGGATLNAAIDKYIVGEVVANATLKEKFRLEYHTDIPTGSGLGSSAAMNVLWLGLVRGNEVKTQNEKLQLARDAFRVEQTLGIKGGVQDQCAAACGGINLFEFSSDGINVHPIELTPQRIEELESHILLCYTGEARLSSHIHENVWGNFVRGDQRIAELLTRMKESAYRCKEVLETGTLEEFGSILALQHECAKHLDASTTNELIERLFADLSPNIFGGKAGGAGGGGCVFFCCKDAASKRRASEKITSLGCDVMEFQFDFRGVVVDAEG